MCACQCRYCLESTWIVRLRDVDEEGEDLLGFSLQLHTQCYPRILPKLLGENLGDNFDVFRKPN